MTRIERLERASRTASRQWEPLVSRCHAAPIGTREYERIASRRDRHGNRMIRIANALWSEMEANGLCEESPVETTDEMFTTKNSLRLDRLHRIETRAREAWGRIVRRASGAFIASLKSGSDTEVAKLDARANVLDARHDRLMAAWFTETMAEFPEANAESTDEVYTACESITIRRQTLIAGAVAVLAWGAAWGFWARSVLLWFGW